MEYISVNVEQNKDSKHRCLYNLDIQDKHMFRETSAPRDIGSNGTTSTCML
jgi:hypothetical protein